MPNALFWDDWLFYDASSENLFNFCSQFGCFFNFHAYVLTTLSQAGLWSYKLLTLLLIFGSGLAINQILKSNNRLFDFNIWLMAKPLPKISKRVSNL